MTSYLTSDVQNLLNKTSRRFNGCPEHWVFISDIFRQLTPNDKYKFEKSLERYGVIFECNEDEPFLPDLRIDNTRLMYFLWKTNKVVSYTEFLLKLGAKPYFYGYYSESLYNIINLPQHDDMVKIIKLFVQYGMNIEHTNNCNEWDPLNWCIMEYEFELFEYLIDNRIVDVNKMTGLGGTYLDHCCEKTQVIFVRKLLESGASACRKYRDGDNISLTSVFKGECGMEGCGVTVKEKMECIQLLLDYGATY